MVNSHSLCLLWLSIPWLTLLPKNVMVWPGNLIVVSLISHILHTYTNICCFEEYYIISIRKYGHHFIIHVSKALLRQDILAHHINHDTIISYNFLYCVQPFWKLKKATMQWTIYFILLITGNSLPREILSSQSSHFWSLGGCKWFKIALCLAIHHISRDPIIEFSSALCVRLTCLWIQYPDFCTKRSLFTMPSIVWGGYQ
jgi:hypothetical protein